MIILLEMLGIVPTVFCSMHYALYMTVLVHLRSMIQAFSSSVILSLISRRVPVFWDISQINYKLEALLYRNLNESKTESQKTQMNPNDAQRKVSTSKMSLKIYVSLFVANYLHLLNANQKLEVKLFSILPFFSGLLCFISLRWVCRWVVL